MQRFDGIDPMFLWQLNSEADRPDLAVILEADPGIISERLAERGPRNRFQLSPGRSHAEAHFYRQVTDRLIQAGFDLLRVAAVSGQQSNRRGSSAIVCWPSSDLPAWAGDTS